MPPPGKVKYRTFTELSLPYVTNGSPVSTNPEFVGGSNILTSIRDYMERRPGFSDPVEPFPLIFANLKRQFVWRRWADAASSGTTAGAYIIMFSDISGANSNVYKLQIGLDSTATLIWSDTTSLSGEPFDFVVSNNTCYFGNGSLGNNKRYDGTTVYNWGIQSPAIPPSITLGGTGISAAVSYCYVTTYGYGTGTGSTAISVGESSPGPLSACTGVFTNKTVSLGVTASTDPQVNQIHIYRTTDGGSTDPASMREIIGSPFANVTATVLDATPDTALGIIPGPPALRNDPPPPMMGMVSYAGRIWGFKNNTVYYSGFEEIGRGVPEECFPGGLDGNFYPYANEVTALAPLNDGVAVFTATPIYKIEGESLDTFRRYTLLEKRGTKSRTAVAALGGSVAWFDTSNQIWISDVGEVGDGIRPDLRDFNPLNVHVVIHISGINHWLNLVDGDTGRIYTYDLDTKKWMPPWTVGTTISCASSYETSPGRVDLMIGRNNTKALKLNTDEYNDDGDHFSAFINTNQFQVSPEQDPSWKGVLDWVEWKRNAEPILSIGQLTDDDPSTGTFVDLTPNIQDTPDITQGTDIVSERANSNNPTCHYLTVRMEWSADDRPFKLYTLVIATHTVGE